MSGTSTLNLDILWVSLVFRKFQECGNLIHKTSDIKVLGIISIPMAILYSNIPWQEVLYSDSHSSGNVGSMQRWNWEMADETCWVETNLNGNMRYMIWNSQFCWLRPSGCWEYSKAESAMLRRQTKKSPELRIFWNAIWWINIAHGLNLSFMTFMYILSLEVFTFHLINT